MLNLAWIAGFVDGEGCFTLLKHTNKFTRWYPRIIIVQAHLGILEEIADALDVPAKIYSKPKQSSTAKQCYSLHIQSPSLVQQVCELLLPHLVLKKDQAEYLLSTLSIPPRERQTCAAVLSSMK